MDLKPYAVGIGRGDGLIARYGDIVMFIADPSASADSLIAAVKSEADSSAPGRQLARRLAALAFGQTVSLAPFGVVAATADGLHVLLYGNVTAEIETPDGTHELAGGAGAHLGRRDRAWIGTTHRGHRCRQTGPVRG